MQFTENTVSVIVGGTSGIGHAVATALRQRPGQVHIASKRDGLDITDSAAIERYFEAIGPFDHLVLTSAAEAPGGKIADVDLSAAKKSFDVKFWGSIAVAKAAAKYLRPYGTMTFTSGFLARRTVPGTFVKTAMNAAIEASAKILARELAPIRVNIVSPGLTDTESHHGMEASAHAAMFERAAASLPAGRYGRPEDIAAGFLLAIDNVFMTGAVIDIDGGGLIN
jgi:NAD(P)-dependent dehydrogenase (short-subunit alcohol dehydrogenase family)